MNAIWEGMCTLCVGGPCKISPRYPLTVISILSFLIGIAWIGLGVWLTVIVILNSSLTYDNQLFFEKLHIIDPGSKTIVFENESSFVFTPLENLKFYLLSMSIIAVLGGLGRAVASLCLLHYVHKKLLPYTMTLAWVILGLLSVVSLAVITWDTLYTLSHTDVSPPHNREFRFKNDHFRFYTFCHIFKYFIITDFVTICYFQWVVRWAQRHHSFAPNNNNNQSQR